MGVDIARIRASLNQGYVSPSLVASVDEIAALVDAYEQRDRYGEALEQIAVGSWNHGNFRPGLSVMQFAREALGPKAEIERTGRAATKAPAERKVSGSEGAASPLDDPGPKVSE